MAKIDEYIGYVADDLHLKLNIARRNRPIPDMNTDPIAKLVEWKPVEDGKLFVKIDACLSHEIVTGTVEDTEHMRRYLARIQSDQQIVPAALRMAGYRISWTY